MKDGNPTGKPLPSGRGAVTRTIDELRLANTEADAMLADANRVIADLREKGEANIRLEQANAGLRAALGVLVISHCVCKCDDDGEFVSQCTAHKEVENERDRLRATLRPFAKAYRLAHLTGLAIGARWCDAEAFARAAELVPEEVAEAAPQDQVASPVA